MKLYFKIFVLAVIATYFAMPSYAQTEPDSVAKSQASQVRRKANSGNSSSRAASVVSSPRQSAAQVSTTHDADLEYMRQIYRRLDLSKTPNAALFYPEDIVDGQENLFRIIFRLVAGGSIPAYEYLGEREVFSPDYVIKASDIISKFDIYAKQVNVKGNENPVYVVDDADVPSSQVLDYYIIEKWEFDRRSNRMKTRVEAVCPVLTRSGEFGDDTKYPMFWVRLEELEPHLKNSFVFTDDDNNVARYSISDFFALGLYDGEIYKTKNLRNLSMAEMFPDEDMRRQAQDSIDNRLKSYGKNLWVPSREEYLAMKEQEETLKAESSDSIPERTTVVANSGSKNTKKTTARRRVSKAASTGSSVKNSTGASSSAAKSVRRRKK